MQPFTTQNRKLAEALALAGCRWASQEDGGPTQNVYTVGFLRDRRLLPEQPVSIAKYESAARSAEERRIPGIVTYMFIRDDTFHRAEQAWQDTCIELQRAELEARPPQITAISPEIVAQVLCIYANSAKNLAAAPFINTAWVTTMSGERKDSDTAEATYTIHGTGKAWPLNASKEVREKLGI